MARAHIYILTISLCVLASACEKAKMRTVPRKTPAPASSASATPPGTQIPNPDADPETANTEGKTPDVKGPVANQPVHTPTKTRTAFEDSDKNQDASTRVRTPGRSTTVTTEDGLVRPGQMAQNRTRPQVIDRGDDELPPALDNDPTGERSRKARQALADCEEGKIQAQEPIEPPAPLVRQRRQVVVREIPQREEVLQIEMTEPTDELHCRWAPTGLPLTFIKYDPISRTASVTGGYPQRTHVYPNVRMVSGLAPYRSEGYSIVSSKGIMIATFKYTNNATLPDEREAIFPYEAYVGNIPGRPQGEAIRGACWTKSDPKRVSESNR